MANADVDIVTLRQTDTSERPVEKRKARGDGWTKELRAAFLDHLAATCHVQASAAAVGKSTAGVYALKRRDPAFAAEWRAAIAAGYERLEEELLAVALGDAGPDAAAAERRYVETGPIDRDLAFKLLSHHRSEAKGGPAPNRRYYYKRVSAAETDAAILKKLEAVERRLAREAEDRAARESGGDRSC